MEPTEMGQERTEVVFNKSDVVQMKTKDRKKDSIS